MSNSMPSFASSSPSDQEDYSLPYPLVHKPLDMSPLEIKSKKLQDNNYEPSEDYTQSSWTTSQTSSAQSSYDPLANLEEYLKVRDQL